MIHFPRALALLEEAVENGDFPSAVVAIGRKEELFAREAMGFANLYGEQRRADFNTLYDIASMTKIYTATLIALKLLEEGRLCLGDTIGQFFPYAPKEKQEITIFRLMTHTGGMPAHFLLEEKTENPDLVHRIILEQPFSVPIGSDVVYSCMGYMILGKILERLCKKPLDELAAAYVFEPLGFTATTFSPMGSNIAATEYDLAANQCLCGVVHDENARMFKSISANAGVFSCIDDAIKLAQMLATGGRAGGKQYLQASTLATAITNHTPGCCENRGLGFKLAGSLSDFAGDLFSRASFGHTGFTGTSLLVEPETGLYVVLFTNRIHPTRANEKLLRFRRLFHNCVKAEYESQA